jgi:hypothetical protein
MLIKVNQTCFTLFILTVSNLGAFLTPKVSKKCLIGQSFSFNSVGIKNRRILRWVQFKYAGENAKQSSKQVFRIE